MTKIDVGRRKFFCVTFRSSEFCLEINVQNQRAEKKRINKVRCFKKSFLFGFLNSAFKVSIPKPAKIAVEKQKRQKILDGELVAKTGSLRCKTASENGVGRANKREIRLRILKNLSFPDLSRAKVAKIRGRRPM